MTEHAAPRSPRKQQIVLGIVVLVLAAVTVLQGFITTRETQRLQQCQAQYANAFADALDARTKASAESQQALDRLVGSIRSTLDKPGATSGQQPLRSAIDDYLAARAKTTAQQRAHPLPPPPRDVCRN